MRKQVVIVLLMPLIGCVMPYSDGPLSSDHPANPDAPTVPPADRSRTLDVASAEPVTQAQSNSMEHGEHGAMRGMHDMHDHDMEQHGMDTTGKHQHSESAALASQGQLYVCPMHPEVTSDKPGQRCPKCGMKLVKGSGGKP